MFFVYPLSCFILGIFLGRGMPEYKFSGSSEIEAELNKVSVQEPVIINDEPWLREKNLQEEEVAPEQYVMNPSAIQQMESDAVLEKEYYVALLNDYVVVYHADRETIYLFTDIKVGELPEEIRVKLENGIPMMEEGALYDFLENYTS